MEVKEEVTEEDKGEDLVEEWAQWEVSQDQCKCQVVELEPQVLQELHQLQELLELQEQQERQERQVLVEWEAWEVWVVWVAWAAWVALEAWEAWVECQTWLLEQVQLEWVE